MPAPVANAPPSDPSSSSTMSGAPAGSAMAKAAEASLERAPAPAAAGPTTTGSHATHTHTAMPPPASPARTGAGAAAANGTRRARANTSPWSFAPNQQPPRSPLMAPPPPVSPNRSGVSPYHPPHPRQPPVSSSMVPPPPFFPAAMGGGAGGVGGGVGRPLTPPISPSGGRRHIHHAPFIHHGHYVHGHHLSQYDAARREAIQHAAEGERRRIGDLEKAESGSDVDVGSLRAALKRERKHSTKLAMELAEWKSLNVQCQAEAEMNEEGRVNHLMRRLECLQREKGRIIVELEREEEMLTNTLQKKLNEVRREKERLEKQIEREHSSNRDLRSRIESSSTTTTSNEGGKSAAAAAAAAAGATAPVDRSTDRGANEIGAMTPSTYAEPMHGSAASLEIPESIAEEEGGSDEEKD